MATRKTPDQILDGAADILEKHGWVTSACYDSQVGGYCVLGALAKAAHPRLKGTEVSGRAYVLNPSLNYGDGTPKLPAHVAAVEFFASRVLSPESRKMRRRSRGKVWFQDDDVYDFNDHLPNGLGQDDRCIRVVVDEKVRLRSSRKVVQKLRSAAKAYRKQQERAAAKAA